MFGGSGDTAGMRLITRAGESMSLEMYLTNDADDWFNIVVPSDNGAKVNGNTIWHAANLTNLNQLTNGPGYISSYSETDTLGSVTNRGNSTTQNLVFSNGRKGLVGVYDAAQTQAIFAMGAAYVLTDGGASSNIGNLYGLAWSYNPDYGGAGNNPQSKAGLNHQLLLMQNGITTAAFGSGIWTSGNVTASTFIGSIAWTSVTSRPTALSSFTNDLGNYGGWVVRTGDTMTGTLTVNTSTTTNDVALFYSTEPHVDITAGGASNTASLRLFPTDGYNALIGQFRSSGKLVLVAANTEAVYVDKSAVTIGTGSVLNSELILYSSNYGNGYATKLQGRNSDGKLWFQYRENSTTWTDVVSIASVGVTATAFFEFSDIRFKNVLETNPVINSNGIDVIKFTRKGDTQVRYGYSAQQVKKVLPEAVVGTDMLVVNYIDVHTLKIASLEKRIAELEAKLNS